MHKLLLLATLFSANVFATPVNINSADAKTIAAALTGINIKQAELIVANRIQNGDFKSIVDLKRVSGIDQKMISANSADILLSNAKVIIPKPIRSNATTGRYHTRTRERHGHTRARPEN